MRNGNNTTSSNKAENVAKVNALLEKVMATPEGSTVMFTNYYCNDRARVDAMKADPEGTLLSVIGAQCGDRKVLDEVRRRMDQCEIHLLQNEADHWYIVLPPRGEELVDVPDDYLEKISGGEYIWSIAVTAIPLVAGSTTLAAGVGAVAILAGTAALVGTAAALALGSITLGALIVTGDVKI